MQKFKLVPQQAELSSGNHIAAQDSTLLQVPAKYSELSKDDTKRFMILKTHQKGSSLLLCAQYFEVWFQNPRTVLQEPVIDCFGWLSFPCLMINSLRNPKTQLYILPSWGCESGSLGYSTYLCSIAVTVKGQHWSMLDCLSIRLLFILTFQPFVAQKIKNDDNIKVPICECKTW